MDTVCKIRIDVDYQEDLEVIEKSISENFKDITHTQYYGFTPAINKKHIKLECKGPCKGILKRVREICPRDRLVTIWHICDRSVSHVDCGLEIGECNCP